MKRSTDTKRMYSAPEMQVQELAPESIVCTSDAIEGTRHGYTYRQDAWE